MINISNLEAAATLHEAVRREIHPGYIKVTISRSPITTEQEQQLPNSTKYVKEVDLTLPPPSSIPINNDENELDLTTFVPPVPPLSRKPPSQHSSKIFCSQKNEPSI